MNCPYCRGNIGGYVQLGTEAYSRVQRGRCPHCGRSMPSGHSVGFAKSTAPRRPDRISKDELEKNKANDVRWRTLSLISSLIGGLCLIKLIGGERVTVWGVVVGSLYFIILFGIAYLQYDKYRGLGGRYDSYTKEFYHTTDDLSSGSYAIFVCIVSALIVIICLFKMIVEWVNS
jgi:hypothetical protein